MWTINIKVQVGGHQGHEEVLDLLVLTYSVLGCDLEEQIDKKFAKFVFQMIYNKTLPK